MGKSASKLSADKLHQYLQNTAFSESEVKLHYKLFMNEFPDGKVDQSQFMNVYKVFHPDGKPDQFAMHVFRVFDNERKGVLGFDDFIKALNVTARGTNEEKMMWAFELYDTDRDGRISRDELLSVVDSIFLMMGKNYTDDQVRKEASRVKVERVFAAMDVDRDDFLSVEEFREGVQQDPAILRLLQQ
ncbi:neuronal calcium sensor 1-like [Symsagittifera roscoffensis]|uniref:neuronal calcium sensor 1-like n=1 Tax=Symsagittifera roscoffensis TaxID=84072 RepID=UPI00307B69FB